MVDGRGMLRLLGSMEAIDRKKGNWLMNNSFWIGKEESEKLRTGFNDVYAVVGSEGYYIIKRLAFVG